jgi:carboxymethylenebutenolidase
MCDQDHYEEDLRKYLERSNLSRRDLGALSLGVGLALLLPRAANAVDVKEQDVDIKTPDGTADAYFVYPAAGAHAGVLIWPDVLGLRPAFRAMSKRLAESGYSVLVVNPFYRQRRAPVVPEGASFADEKVRAAVLQLAQQLNATTHTTDAKAFVAWLDSQPAVDKGKKIGTMGYCMGGPITMRTAAAVPERVGAGASFHGGGLVTNAPDSPHLLVPKIKAQYLFAIADNDDMREPDAKNVLRDAFAKVNLPAEIEVYKGAMHGWCPPDSMVYDKEKAERAWSRLLVLFEHALA